MASCHSIVDYTLDGVTLTPYSFTAIPLLPTDTVAVSAQIEVYLDAQLLLITTDYTLVGQVLTLIAAHSAGNILSIRRKTKVNERYVDYINGGILSEQTLDLDSDQLFYLIQENFCELTNTLRLLGNCWNGQGFTTCNFAAGTTNNSLVTLGQVINLINGLGSVNVGSVNYVTDTGTGSQVDFDVTALGLSLLPTTHDLFVTVDNVLQDSGLDYSTVLVGSVHNVRFATAPVNGAIFTARSIEGSVVAQSQPGSVNGTNLIDGTVDIAKLVDTVDENNPWSATAGADGQNKVVILRANAENASPLPASTLFRPIELAHNHIHDFHSSVVTSRLDEMATPTEAVNMGSQIIENLSMGSAINSGLAANVGYVIGYVATQISQVTNNFLQSSQHESLEASADGLIGTQLDAKPRTGTIGTDWGGGGIGPVRVRILASTANGTFTPAAMVNKSFSHFHQSGTPGFGGDEESANGVIGSSKDNGWEGDYNAAADFLVQSGGWAGYLINTGGADLYLWLNVNADQIEWELAGSSKVASAVADQLFQIRFEFGRTS